MRLGMILLSAASCYWAVTTVQGEEAENTPEARRESSPLRRFIDDSLTWYELSTESAAPSMSPRVVMRWANNIRGSEGGATVLYLQDGIPQAACSIYPWEQQFIHEFDSLSRGTLVAKRHGALSWSPNKPGVEYQAVPMAEAPAESAVQRLRQMKAISSQFSSTMLGWKPDRSDRESLRLLPQPLYRYENPPAQKCLDGAVFAFVQGTDPEALLILEAVPRGQTMQWEFAFVRQTSGELEARYKDAIVWHADKYPSNRLTNGVHFSAAIPLPLDVRESLKPKE